MKAGQDHQGTARTANQTRARVARRRSARRRPDLTRLKQLVPPLHLRVLGILDLQPGRAARVGSPQSRPAANSLTLQRICPSRLGSDGGSRRGATAFKTLLETRQIQRTPHPPKAIALARLAGEPLGRQLHRSSSSPHPARLYRVGIAIYGSGSMVRRIRTSYTERSHLSLPACRCSLSGSQEVRAS